MLTKELILCKLSNGRLKPQFILPEAPELQDLAARLLAPYQADGSTTRADIEELSAQIITGSNNPKLAAGLQKIIDDQAEYSAPQDIDYAAARFELFKAAAGILKESPGLAEDQYRQKLRHLTADNPLAGQESIFADLPENDRLVKLNFITPKQVLERYNCGLVQGLLLHASNLQLTVVDADPAKLRRLFKYLRFFRLLARITVAKDATGNDTPDSLNILIDGPASLFDQSRRYGLQLACFFPAVCALDNWKMRAEITWKNAQRFLVLDESSRLVCPYHNFTAYVPEEIQLFHRHFKETVKEWTIVGNTPYIKTKGNEVIFPDLSFQHENGEIVHLELFHRWHSTQLADRLDWLDSHADIPLIIGVDRALLKDGTLQEKLEKSLWFARKGFLFKDYPTVEKTLHCLKAR